MKITKSNIHLRNSDPEKIWGLLENYCGYAFNKSHAVAYSIISYITEKSWIDNKEKFLEFKLNLKDKNFNEVVARCKDMNMKFNFPTLNNCNSDRFIISNNTVNIPGKGSQNYESAVDLLFGDNNDSKLILEGVLNYLSYDRTGLLSLSTSVAKKYKQTLLAMPEVNSLTELLDNMKLTGAIVDWYKSNLGNIYVDVRRVRGEPSRIEIRKDYDSEVIKEALNYDNKYFGIPRPGIIDNMPYVNTTGIENTINNLKEKFESKNIEPYYKLRDKLNEYLKEMPDFKKEFNNIKVVLDDYKNYEKSTKVWFKFNDKTDFFYVYDEEIRNKIPKIKKGKMVKVNMVYSPFIKKRNNTFVYDFDILSLEEL